MLPIFKTAKGRHEDAPSDRKKHEKENCLGLVKEKVSVFGMGLAHQPELPKGQL